VDYDIEGMMYDANTKYEGFINTISPQLGVDTIIFHLELKYVVSGPSPPMKIHNDMSVQVYLDQKRFNYDFISRYPLCVTCVDKAMSWILLIDEELMTINSFFLPILLSSLPPLTTVQEL